MPQGMTEERAAELRKMIKRIGAWTGMRWMRNQGVPFEHAHWLMFGVRPRR